MGSMRSLPITMTYVFFAVAISLFGQGEAAHLSEIDAKLFVQDASSKIYNAYNKMNRNFYDSDNEEDLLTILWKIYKANVISKELVEISKKAQMYEINEFKDNELKLALLNLRKVGDIFVLGDEFFSSAALHLGSLKRMGTEKDIEPYQNGIHKNDVGYLSYYPDIQRVFGESKDPEELKYYWKTWREKNRERAALNFYSVIESFRKAANISNMSVLEFWYRDYDDKDFLIEMENVVKQLKPFYLQLHAFIRLELSKEYGEKVLSSSGPIPDHLFQQVIIQAWKNESVIGRSFPNQFLPPYDLFVQEKVSDAKELLKIAEDFYVSLGIEPMDETFWKERVKLQNEDVNDSDCNPGMYLKTPNIYMEYCGEVDFRNLMQAHGYMGQVVCTKLKENLPAYFFNSYNLEYPVGEAVILSASTPKHLSTIGLAKDYKFSDEILMNQLLRMSIQTMLNVPVYFVYTKVLNDLLNGAIDMEGVNKHYWSLMEEYAGVEPPLDRPENSIDLPHEFYTDLLHNHQARNFVSEILGYQFYQVLCEKSGHVGELHNCDFYKSKNAGSALKEMMSLGSTKPWRNVLSTLLSENSSFSADGLLEYYAPVQFFLEKKNQESNAKIGWNASAKKVL